MSPPTCSFDSKSSLRWFPQGQDGKGRNTVGEKNQIHIRSSDQGKLLGWGDQARTDERQGTTQKERIKQ